MMMPELPESRYASALAGTSDTNAMAMANAVHNRYRTRRPDFMDGHYGIARVSPRSARRPPVRCRGGRSARAMGRTGWGDRRVHGGSDSDRRPKAAGRSPAGQ